MDYRYASLTQLKIFERPVGWMYRDSSKEGNCTCAAGKMLPGPEAAQALPWMIPVMGTGTPQDAATPLQISHEYFRVMAMPPGLLAEHYRIPSSLLLDGVVIDDLLIHDQDRCEAALRATLFDYDEQPDAAKIAEIDMEYNLGPGGLAKYTFLLDCIRGKDYVGASLRCGRNTSDPAFNARNLWTKNQFRAAAGLEPIAL